MQHNITEKDEGKRVLDGDGNMVGMVKSVEHGTAYIDPDPGMTDKLKSKFGWGDADEDTYPLQEESIDTVTDDEIRLRSQM